MRQKESDLLRYLLDNQNRFVTGDELAGVLSLSPRTIRNYIKILKIKLNLHGATFEAKPSFGYRLHISHPVTFDLFLNKDYQLSQWQTDDSDETDISDRQKYILNKLVIENRTFLIDDVAERLFVTRSTLSKDLSIIRKNLIPYALTIENKPNKGVFITGLERNRRHFILDYFFTHSDNSFQHYMENKSFFKTISFDQITIIVLDECRESGIHLTDFTIQNIVLYIALSVQRMAGGFELQSITLENIPEIDNVYTVAQKIIKRIEKSYHLQMPESEIAYLTIQLMAKGKNPNITSDENLQKDLDIVLQQIEIDTGLPVSQDYELRKNLIEHLRPMIIRLEQGLQLKNPLLQEIKTRYPSYFLDVKRYVKLSTYLSRFDINDDEIAYLALHLMATSEKYRDLNKPRVLIICATGYGSAQLLNNRLEKEFGKHLNIVGVKGYYEVDDVALKGVDLIISAIDLSTQVFKIPVIQVSVFLTEVDIKNLKHFLDHIRVNPEQLSMTTEKANTSQVLSYFDQFTDSSRFKIWDEPTYRKDVLDQLSDMITTDEPSDFKQELLDQIAHRELLSAITFSDVIAVPHPARAMSRVPKIAIGVIPSGLKWSTDYPSIKLVFLLSPSYLNNQGLTETTQTIVYLAENPEKQAELILAKDFSEFRKKFMLLMKGGKNT
ncbi:BglG family transcription antiterminator [Leuconostoc gelidum subsp. aenigmaticum]|uniref:BglG family transcription antiterminator n=1 Tax=Leuconostoc gelidum TaxID=1244 RepID=UPI001CC3BF6D|nr:BglG family transcription antiterminator [Leuconostoc gelidum]MBZ6008629.1 BglG family transcription antiterminator [Leuconostoc gelidum subsp. aenigmaticum]